MSVQSSPVFDARVNIPVMFPSEDGFKTVVVRQPSDEQLCRRARARKIITKDLGRGASETTVVPNETVDAQIFAEIRVSGDGAVDSAEAMAALDRISEAEDTGVSRDGSKYRITLRVLGVSTVTAAGAENKLVPSQCYVDHVLKMPTQRQVMDYRRDCARAIALPHGRREMRMNIDVAGELYDKLRVETTGYADGSAVPLSHKGTAVSAALQMLERELAGEAIDPENF